MKKLFLSTLLLSFGFLLSCSSEPSESTQPTKTLKNDGPFELPAGPELQNVTYDEPAPVYFFLFTHTEDHINHELSEERYWRIGELLEEIRAEYPSLPLTWTLEFQGADAETVLERNPETGLVDYLSGLGDKGLVDFGYHAHHDPTYLNRPQKNLTSDSTWDEVYTAIHSWVTCRKDPLKGGCLAPTGGGLQAVMEAFGEVEIVTGVGTTEGAQIERGAGAAAILYELPERMLAFGFPDHGATMDGKNYVASRDALMTVLSPTNETSGSVFWMDNSLRINDGATVDGMDSLDLKAGKSSNTKDLSGLNRERPHVINTGIASKYMYAKVGKNSPTQWAYSNVANPELPASMLNTEQEKEKNYASTSEALWALVRSFLPANPGSRFVSSDEVVELFTSDDYWTVEDAELEQISYWLLNEWGTEPPVYAYDGEDFYSLTDSFVLFTKALQGENSRDDVVSRYYGPWSLQTVSSEARSVDRADFLDFVLDLRFEDNRLEESYTIEGEKWSPAQVLYGLALAYVDLSSEEIEVPAMQNAPSTYAQLEDIGCIDCLDTTWSLKPARFQD